ncbi:MAG: hypothetical protein ABSA34_05390, partial [Candidatus Goldiibacteriota bacterium]
MKKFRVFVYFVFFGAALCMNTAAATDDGETPQEFNVKGVAGGTSAAMADESKEANGAVKEKIMQAGALEKVERD